MIQRSVESITAKDRPFKRNMAMNSATRLLIMTVIGLTVAYVFKPGLGVVFGMALFQVILVACTTLPSSRRSPGRRRGREERWGNGTRRRDSTAITQVPRRRERY